MRRAACRTRWRASPAQHLQERIGQSVVVENRAGGGGSGRRERADGRAGRRLHLHRHRRQPRLDQSGAVQAAHLQSEGHRSRWRCSASTPLFLAAHPDLPVSTLREFVDYVKAHPGEINYGSSGVGSVHHLSMEAMKAALELQDDAHPLSRHRPVGAGAARRPCARCCSRPIRRWSARSRARRSSCSPTTAPTRSLQAPDVPPIADVIPGFDLATIVGIFAQAGHAAADPRQDRRGGDRRASTRRRRRSSSTAAGIEPDRRQRCASSTRR